MNVGSSTTLQTARCRLALHDYKTATKYTCRRQYRIYIGDAFRSSGAKYVSFGFFTLLLPFGALLCVISSLIQHASNIGESPRRVFEHAIVMSCPDGQSATHNGGNYKPSKQTTGIKAVINSMEKYGSKLPLIVAYFKHERSILENWCNRLKAESNLTVQCVQVNAKYPNGYGISKITVLKSAPCKHCLWLDCDMYPTRKLDEVFEDTEYKKTGTYFVGDFFDLFDEYRAFSSRAFQSHRSVSLEFMRKWWVKMGFDSGLLAINKDLRQSELNFLSRIASKQPKSGRGWKKTLRNGWGELSMGDKDLWKLSLIAKFVNYTMVPYVGAVGSFRGIEEKFILTSQLKHNRRGEVIAYHQLHRDHRLPSELYNRPSVAIRVDLRSPGKWFDLNGFKFHEAYANVVSTLSANQIQEISGSLSDSISDMARAWGYDQEQLANAQKLR